MERRRIPQLRTGHIGAALRCTGARGGSLVELLIGVMVVGVMMAISFSFARSAFQSVRTQEAHSEARQALLLALDLLVREVRMAGFSASGARLPAITTATLDRVEVVADFDGDGASDGPNELIAYSYNAAKRQLVRATGGASPQPLVHNVPAGGLAFAYYDSSGSVLPVGNGAMTLADRQRIHRIDVVLRTEIPPRPSVPAAAVMSVSGSIGLRNQGSVP